MSLLNKHALAAGAIFYDLLAAQLLRVAKTPANLARVRVVLPSLRLIKPLQKALLAEAQKAEMPLFLPQFTTLNAWAETLEMKEKSLAESERRVLLYEALRAQNWFSEGALWHLVDEMSALFDELTKNAVILPKNHADFCAQLAKAYQARASLPLAFEAKVVHEMWHAMQQLKEVDAVTLYQRRLAQLAETAAETETAFVATFFVAEDAPMRAFSKAEQLFLEQFAKRQVTHFCYPQALADCKSGLETFLKAAWEDDLEAEEGESAMFLSGQFTESPLQNRLSFIAANGREQEACAIIQQISRWQKEGLKEVALIAADRSSARRVRALLERENVLLEDESGWTIATSRAGALIDALFEIASNNAYHRDFLDLIKSPFVFSHFSTKTRENAVFLLEKTINQYSLKHVLEALPRALAKNNAEEKTRLTAEWICARVGVAQTILNGKEATIAAWITRIHKVLEALNALEVLKNDDAGQEVLRVLLKRQTELVENQMTLSFDSFRHWLNREFELAHFADQSIQNSLRLMSLESVQLRLFEAAIFIGGDKEHLQSASKNTFFNHAVRSELELTSTAQLEAKTRQKIELLLRFVPKVIVSWQALNKGEARALAPVFDLLTHFHARLFGDNLIKNATKTITKKRAKQETLPQKMFEISSVAAPLALLPNKISVSAAMNLMDCPYRFFARSMLRLNAVEEVTESMQKSDYGQFVHRALEVFHQANPSVLKMKEEQAENALSACVDAIFKEAIHADFLAHSWRLRFKKQIKSYLKWQRNLEAEGFRFQYAEQQLTREIVVNAPYSLLLYGRIDREDVQQKSGEIALFDYKTQKADKIQKRLEDDIQLPLYAYLRRQNKEQIQKSTYLALDDEQIAAYPEKQTKESIANQEKAQIKRLGDVFNALFQEEKLPANAPNSKCQYCEMEGLCRKKMIEEYQAKND